MPSVLMDMFRGRGQTVVGRGLVCLGQVGFSTRQVWQPTTWAPFIVCRMLPGSPGLWWFVTWRPSEPGLVPVSPSKRRDVPVSLGSIPPEPEAWTPH